MTWLTYPYFWGRKSQWQERVAYEDVDPVFNQFLKAGYCRVVVPVRPGFEGAIDHFMTYRRDLEWRAAADRSRTRCICRLPTRSPSGSIVPATKIPQGDPWLVRIPTTLVHLRPDDQLPRWKQDANGDWVEE